MFYTVRIPAWFSRLSKSLTWSFPGEEKILYLTFDDGPHETATPFVLDALKQYNAKATFFCLGKNVAAHPGIYARLLNEGHSAGNHTYNHLNGWKVSETDYLNDIKAAQQRIQSSLFRPPYGRIFPSSIKKITSQLQLKIIMWNILSGDFDASLSPQKCLQNVIEYATNGSVIVFHDSAKAFVNMRYALPQVLKFFSEKGYSFRSIH